LIPASALVGTLPQQHLTYSRVPTNVVNNVPTPPVMDSSGIPPEQPCKIARVVHLICIQMELSFAYYQYVPMRFPHLGKKKLKSKRFLVFSVNSTKKLLIFWKICKFSYLTKLKKTLLTTLIWVCGS
jgi:hypothetical protein